MDMVTDLTRGIYRRIYSGFIAGQRINKLSLSAEAWFWRVLAVVDDLGNAPADPDLCRAATSGRRSVTRGQVSGWLKEMKTVGLISLYKAKGEWFLHVIGFEESQPAGKNGKRIQRYPIPGESGCIQVNPDVSSASQASDNDNDNEDDNEKEVRAERSRSKLKTCDQDYLSELQADAAYRALNVPLIHAKMLRWCSEKGKQPTRARLINWLNREDQPMESNGNGTSHAIPRTASDRNVANLKASLDILRERSGQDDSAESVGLVATRPQPRRISSGG